MTEDSNQDTKNGLSGRDMTDFPRLPYGVSHISEIVAVIVAEVERRQAGRGETETDETIRGDGRYAAAPEKAGFND